MLSWPKFQIYFYPFIFYYLFKNWVMTTLIEVNARYFFSDGLHVTDPTLYRIIVGSLVYLTITRPDIAYVVHVVSQFVTSPITVH